MFTKSGKRVVSLLLALIMIFSVMPTQAFATEAHDHEEEGAVAGSEQTEVSTTPSELAVDLVNRVNAIVEDYGINADMTEDEIFDAMYEKSDDELFATMDEMDALSEAAEAADAADELYVGLHANLEAYGKLADAMNQLREIALFADSGSHKPVAGVTVGVSGATDNSMSNGAVTVTAKGSGGIFGFGASAKTATITVYNESGSKAKISFDWTANSVNQLKIDGTVYSGSSGSFEKVMDAGESFVITITTAKNGTTNKLVMKNFTCEAVKESSKVTFQYDSSLGSITVAGAATETGVQLDISSAGAELKATAANGGAFLGWIDADTHVILSRDATYTLEPAGDMTVKAIFAKNACFLVNGNALYESLDEALAAVKSVTNKTIILDNSGILPAGNYTIPSGVTLLIPYDAANTLCTTAPVAEEATYNEKTNLPTVYRKLTMAEGAHITVNGAISLSARVTASGGLTAPFGACSFIQMESDSSITVKNGGNLYAWGFIQGSGVVIVENGGTVYECFQVRDWRGGDNTSGMVGNSQRVFPMSQYYIQNIEVPMTLQAGAIENGYMSVAVSLIGIQGSQVPFIGPSGMFQITSGYIVKDYDENTGRLLIDVYGNLSVKSLSISMKLGLLGSKTINSKDYVLPINGNMTINMHSGSVTMTQDIALLPGAQLIIGEGATCTLGSGNKIFVYDYDQWILDTGDANDQGDSFVGTGDATHVNLIYPTSARTVQGRTDDAYVEVNGTADLSQGYVYTTTGGANICGTGTIIMQPGSADQKTYQVKCLGSDNKTVKYYEIPITSAVIKNADGTEVYTDKAAGTYENIDGVWVKTVCNHDFVETVTKAPTCTETGLKNQVCKDTVNCGHVVENVEVPALGHTAGADATCTTAQTCTVCGAEIKKALGHTEATTAPVAPTCTETGLTEGKHCSVCNAVIVAQEVVPALGHKPGAAATCTTAQTCTVCNAELVKALGHTPVTDAAKAPTCTETGLTEGSHCSVCGETLVAQDEVPALGHTAGAEATCTEAQTCTVCGAEIKKALGHTEAVDAAKAPTCTETGLTEGKHCSVCNTVLVKQDVVDALGHTAGAEATCTTAQTCTVCNAELVKALGHQAGAAATCTTAQTCTVCGAELAPALNHDLIRDNEIPATCTEPGHQAGAHCSRCDYTEGGGEIPALGHNPGAEATCTTAQTCTVCGAEIKKALGHTEAVDAAKAPTCTETGLTEGKHCSVCNTVIVAQEEIPELGHKPGAEATCTTAQTCTVCNAELATALGHKPGAEATCTTAQTCTVCNAELVKALGHTAGAEATCTEAQTCTVCNAELVAALGHDKVVHNAKAPTCTEHGWEAYLTCSRCDYTTYDEIPATGHLVLVFVEATAATCQKEGVVEHWLCPACSGIFADEAATQPLDSITAPIDPDNHNFATEGETTAATCKAEGKIVYPCQNEGCEVTKVETLPIDPEGHVWDEGRPYKNHSCNSAAYMIYTCTLCKVENKVVVREQHFRVPIADEIPATCTTDGMTSGWKCEKCDEFWIPQEVIPALGHDWNGALPCQSETSACTRCDLHFDTKQEHLVVTVTGTPATCDTVGLTDGAYCGYCGEILVEQTEIPMTEHTWITTEMEIPATCNSVGHNAGATYCMYCDYDENAKPVLEHEWMHRDAKKATYSAIGWNAHDYCLLCNTTRTLEQYEGDPCEFCGENPEGYIEIPKVEVQKIATADEFLTNLGYLEQLAAQYAMAHPGTDPLALVLNYMRTAVANYTTGSWAIMAGPENKDFLKFVQEAEDAINSDPEVDVWVNISGLKKLGSYTSPSNEQNHYRTYNSKVPFLTGHFFGTMDMTYYNKGSQNHADVGGWVGDLTDLLSTTDEFGVPANLTLEEKIAYITNNYLFKDDKSGSAGAFGSQDLYADLDAYFIMNELITKGYNAGDLENLLRDYFKPGLTLQQRAAYLLTNRLDGLSTRKDLRNAVYNAYTSNKLISTLEGTRNFNASGNELAELRKAVCYAFADEMCRLAGDYVEDLNNPRYTVFDTETKILAPGVSQQITYATNADGKQIVFYIATADVKRDDVGMWVNYYDRDPGTPENPEWKNNSVPSSAQNAQDRYGDPSSLDYIPNFSVIASTNAGGYDMSDVATPGGLVVMNGIEWYPQTNTAGFFAIMDDGTAYMGTHDEYQALMDAGRIKEAIGGFGEFVVKDGKVVGNATYSDAPRTSVGITQTGRVVIMCIDGRQAPFSSGASLQDVGYIMREAGCVIAINLDGGGSTTFVARQPGSDDLTIMNRPSDGYPRNVSTNLLIYSTAPSSTAFDHAVIESEYDYATIDTAVQMTAAGVSPSGNAVDVPEGATWAVSDEAWATISEDGVFTGKRLGEVYVYLMLDGQVIGSKLMTITNPDQLYFEKAKVDAIYGSSVKLPLLARFEGKPIAINPDDVTITLSAPAAGKMEGFSFVAVESSVKTLTITAAIGDISKTSINVMLYKQGENSFDFDKATGGDRTLAWHREVTNAKVEDGNIYNVINPAEDMVASYIFAMDMTAIPIPERLQELTYMLPGGTMEGANAWTFLTSLAQRISDLSWVKATIDFDDRFVVDYSELKILNDYFTVKSLEFDETTNTLTLTMQWIKQSQVIDAATANPLCLINGLKLTPKEGVWEDTSKINVVTSGTIGYEIYMRASGLYGFAQKPESQAVFGVYPYRNPNDTSDAGGYFRDTYVEIVDEYTLVNAVKEGWINEDGGFAYYVEGERLTGIQQVEGFYYDFGETGVNVGQTKFTGLFFDEEANAYRYSYIGELASGWQSIGGEWYYFKDLQAAKGSLKISGVTYDFEENGKLVSGKWVNVFTGWRYYYGPTYVQKHWYEIDGEWYYFREGIAVTGYQYVGSKAEVHSDKRWRSFDENGVYQGDLTGIYLLNDKYYYVEDGKPTEKGLFVWGGAYYYAQWDGTLICNQRYYAWKLDSTSELPKGTYEFGPDGRMLGTEGDNADGVVEKDGVLYYYENGQPTEKGLFIYDGHYYYSQYDGKLICNQKYYAWKLDSTSELPVDHYEFGEDGRMLNGIVDKDGVLYYYENGKRVHKGLFLYNGHYYDAEADGKLITDQKYYVWKLDTSAQLPKDTYEFGADGRMLQGIVNKSDVLYYYVNGKPTEMGLFYQDGYHYYAQYDGKLITGQKYYAWRLHSSSQLPVGHYEFAEDGRVLGSCDGGEITSKNGLLYYYENGKPTEKGLFKMGGYYYYSQWDGQLITSGRYYAWRIDASCDLPVGTYEFDEGGRMLQGIVNKSGVLYYYVNGKPTEMGLFKIGDDYYYSQYDGKLITDQKYYAWRLHSSCDLPVNHYEFDAEGKMLQGIVDKDGTKYFYENGRPVEKGLFFYEGNYYYSQYDGKLICGQKYYAWKHDITSALPSGHYEFDAEGKMLGASSTGEIVLKNGTYYYYENGKPVDKGLFFLNGYYYFALYNGELVVNQKYYVYRGNDLLFEKTYTFNELGQIIG